MYGQPQVLVAEVLCFERFRVVLGVAGDEYLPAAVGGDGVDARDLALRKDLKARFRLHLLRVDGGVAGVRDEEHIVEAAEEYGSLVDHFVLENAEHLLGKRQLADPVVIVQAGLGAPADVIGAVDVGLGPLHYLAELVPVVHFLERQVLHGRAGDHHAVEALVLYLVEGLVEGQHVLLGGVLGLVAYLKQLHVDLNGGVAQKPCKLGLRYDLGGHEVEDEDAQRTYVLGGCALRIHYEYVLVLQRLGRGQILGYSDRHCYLLGTSGTVLKSSVLPPGGSCSKCNGLLYHNIRV